jgi:hypothetical protein
MEHILWTPEMMGSMIWYKNTESLMRVTAMMKTTLPQECQDRSVHAALRKWFHIVGGPVGYFESSGTIQMNGSSGEVPSWTGMDYFLVAIGFYGRSVHGTDKDNVNQVHVQ